MTLPSNFKSTISSIFYDKTFNVYASNEVVDDVGDIVTQVTIAGNFKGNIRFDRLDELQKDYGITEDIQASITTNDNIELGSIIGYVDQNYRIIKSVPFDSHYLLFAQKWSLKSTTLISL